MRTVIPGTQGNRREQSEYERALCACESYKWWCYLAIFNPGGYLSYGSLSLNSKDGDFSYRGTITKVNRREAGSGENSFVSSITLPIDGSLNNKTLIIEWGNGWTWGYKIKEIIGNRIITGKESGFDYDGDGIYMQYFPVPEYFGSESFPGPITFKIAGSAVKSAALAPPQNLRVTSINN